MHDERMMLLLRERRRLSKQRNGKEERKKERERKEERNKKKIRVLMVCSCVYTREQVAESWIWINFFLPSFSGEEEEIEERKEIREKGERKKEKSV